MEDPRRPANPAATAATRGEPVECPHCGEPTMPNRLADASTVCSCPVQRALPTDGGRWEPPPVDDASFGMKGATEHPMPPPGLPSQAATPPEEARARPCLPGDHGQFGRDIATEDYRPLNDPPVSRSA